MPDGNYNHKHERKLILLVGNIASGKSTYLKKLNGEYLVLSRDKIRYMIGDGYYVFHSKFETAIWNAELELFKSLLETGVNLVIDEVNVNSFMRERYISEMRYLVRNRFSMKDMYEVTAVVFHKLTMKEAVERRMREPHGVFTEKDWEKVWTNFDKRSSVPTLEEGFDKIIILNKDGSVKETICSTV